MWECCRCFRQSPKNNTLGYACDAAQAQGFKNISIWYWLENDPNRPTQWGKRKPGPVSVFSTLCEQCQKITLQEYFEMVQGFVLAHDYRHQHGAGGHYNLNTRFGNFDSWIMCANCRREVHKGSKDSYDKHFKEGYILVGGHGVGSLSFCPECPRKLSIKEMEPLYHYWQAKYDKEQEKRMKGINACCEK